MKTYHYTLSLCSGKIEKITVPSLWSPAEVAAKLPHSLVFLHVPAKAVSYTETRTVEGPAIVLVAAPGCQGVTHGELYAIPQLPLGITDDRAALHCYTHREE